MTVPLAARFGVGLQLEYLGQDDQVLQQVVYALAGLGAYRADDGVAAPLLADEVVLGQLLLDALRVGAGHIHLVDGHDDGDVRRLGVVDGLYGLGHDAVVGRNDQDGDVRDGRAAGAHTGEGLVTRGVQEGDRAALDVDGVGADVLRDAAGLSGGDVGLADVVQQAGLAVVDVTHDHDYRGARLQLLRPVFAVVYQALLDGDDHLVLDLAAQLHGHERGGVVVDYIAQRGHDAVLDERLYDLGAGLLHAGGQLADADGVGYLNLYGRLLGYLELQLLHTLALLGAALGAGRGLLLALLLLVGELLLAAALASGVRAVSARHAVKALVVLAEVDVAAAAGVNDALLGHLAGDVLLLLLGLSRLLRALGRGGALSPGGLLRGLGLGSGLLLLRLRLLLHGGHAHQVLHGRALVLLGQVLENHGQLRVLKHLHVVLGRGGVLGQYLCNVLGGKAKVLGHLVNPILVKTTHLVPSPVSFLALWPCGKRPCRCAVSSPRRECRMSAGLSRPAPS